MIFIFDNKFDQTDEADYMFIFQIKHHRHLFHSKNICPPPLPYFKVNIYPLPLPHFASIFFSYLWSFRWPNYIVTLPRYFSFRLPHLNIPTGTPSDKLDDSVLVTLWPRSGHNFERHNKNLSSVNYLMSIVNIETAFIHLRSHIYLLCYSV